MQESGVEPIRISAWIVLDPLARCSLLHRFCEVSLAWTLIESEPSPVQTLELEGFLS